LFGRSRDKEQPRPVVSFNWLAPVTACLLFLFVTVQQGASGWTPRSRTNSSWPEVAMTLSNVSLAAYLPGSFANEQNSLPADTFKWTKRAHSPSSIPLFRLSETNQLNR
jgi:hypothetical protein